MIIYVKHVNARGETESHSYKCVRFECTKVLEENCIILHLWYFNRKKELLETFVPLNMEHDTFEVSHTFATKKAE